MTIELNPGAVMPQAFTYEDIAEVYASARRDNLGANTTIRLDGDDYIVRLYNTDILVYRRDNTITLNAGGHKTRTTMNRINAFLSPKATVYAKGGKWYIKSGSGVYPFENGVTLTSARGGVRENPRRHPGYKGLGIEFPEDRFAYRGYSVQLGSDKEWWYISKDGHHIGSAATADKAREIIADLTADTYGGER